MVSVFILCAGSGKRWKNHLGVPKQLVRIGGESLVGRMSRQVVSLGSPAPIIVSRKSQIITAGNAGGFTIDATDSLAETILCTGSLWTERNVFLLGDVFFTDSAIRRILESPRPLAFFGRPWPSAIARCGHGELFALAFSTSARIRSEYLVRRTFRNVDSGLKGNLWNIYQLASNAKWGTSPYDRELMDLVDDMTNDIDTPPDYTARAVLFERIASARNPSLAMAVRRTKTLPAHLFGKIRWAVRGASLVHPAAFRGENAVSPPSPSQP
jgi:hypothetical protein